MLTYNPLFYQRGPPPPPHNQEQGERVIQPSVSIPDITVPVRIDLCPMCKQAGVNVVYF